MVRLTTSQHKLTISALLVIIVCPILYLFWLEDEVLQLRVAFLPPSGTEKKLIAIFGEPMCHLYETDRAKEIIFFHQRRWDGREIAVVADITDGVTSAKVVGQTRSILARWP